MHKNLWISTGKSRLDINWKNEEISWQSLVERLRTPHVTTETFLEYSRMNKTEKSNRKDVGGFLGGTITGGRRKKENINARSVLCLETDNGGANFWEQFCEIYNQAAFLYGTHSHSEKEAHLRLVMPMEREVQADEYEAIGRRVAGNLDIEIFDPSTFQPERLMYWPSVSRDVKYYWREQAGEWLDPDRILGTYRDWRDMSQWPYHESIEKAVRTEIKKQADPLGKTGIVGAFCRVYDIEGAIDEYLKDVYAATEVEDRYTLIGGSTAAGLVIYEDKFAYSYHGTDPAREKLCNAFDLVRYHKFGDLDKGIKKETNATKYPSYSAMIELINQDRRVMGEVGAQKLKEAKLAFSDSQIEEVKTEEHNWRADLEMDKKQKYYTSYKNIALILENDPRLKGKLRFNDLLRRTEAVATLPWDRGRKYPRGWTDADWGHLRKMLGLKPYELLRSPKLEDCMNAVVENNRYHPIKEYLEGLTWDKVERVDHVLEDYLGCESSEYIQTVTRKTLLAGVARIFEPGIKFDYVLTLVGPGGIGKSTLIGRLGRDWFSDTFNFHMLKGKEAFEQIQGFWVIEINEMAGLRRAEVEAAKSYLSSRFDSFRPAYGRELVTLPRQCIFIGSSNNREFLKKVNGGNRRFWPADCGVGASVKSVWDDLTRGEVDQIWAEAVQIYRSGEVLELSAGMGIEARRVQGDHEETNDLAGVISEFLEIKLPESWEQKTMSERQAYFAYFDDQSEPGVGQRNRVCAGEIWVECLKKPRGEMTTNNTKFIHEIMEEVEGWHLTKSKSHMGVYGRVKSYERGSNDLSHGARKNDSGSGRSSD